jgi:hypothetical protein
VAGGYFLLGKVFKMMNRLEVTESLYNQVTDMWYNHLRRLLQSRVIFNELDAMAGTLDDENQTETNDQTKLGKNLFYPNKKIIFSCHRMCPLDLATEAEAFNTLETLLAHRIDTYQNDPMLQEINRIQHSLTILYFLGRDYNQVRVSMSKLQDCSNKEMIEDQQRIQKFLEQLDRMKTLMKRQQQI